jgi:pimeloyl-ACP methyl ester carboxylesterase
VRTRTAFVTAIVFVAGSPAMLALGPTSAAGAAVPAASIKAHLLTVSDLPAGWSPQRSTSTRLDLGSTPCLRGFAPKPGSGESRATASFSERSGLPALAESLASGHSGAEFDEGVAALGRCHSLTLTVESKHVKATITRTSLSVRGTAIHAFSLALTVTLLPIGVDVVLFRTKAFVGELIYVGVGTPTPVTARVLVGLAISKAEGRVVPAVRSVSAVSAPVKIAHTARGAIGYREVGSGSPPLVMIMGFAGTMEAWDPRFVDALAHHHEVVIFDNAGIGDTRALPAPLTIDEMADQTSALINTLRLGKADVLGWSMGSMIAEALAVLHPSQVNRLVLCAAYPGTGTVVPTENAIKDLTHGDPKEVLADLFPPNQRAAATGYEFSLSAWPGEPSAALDVVAAQEGAITRWWGGRDPAGRRAGEIAAPTLVADGTLDRLDPQANARRLEKLIPGAQLTLYPDAGHAFLFQDETAVIPEIDSFLQR